MFKKSLSLVVASSLLFVSSSTIFSPIIANASTIQEESSNAQVIKNDKYIQLENELAKLQQENDNNHNHNRSSYYSNDTSKLTETQTLELLKKYDGATKTIIINATVSYQEKLVNGGINYFASTTPSMEELRSDLATTATATSAGGIITGALAGGVIGAIFGGLASDLVATRLQDGADTMQEWINAGSTSGGTRLTLTEEFPISSINSTSQAPIN